MLSGVTMVLIPSVSAFYIYQKLGNVRFFLVGDAIEGQYVANNLHFATAMALILMMILLVFMAIAKYAAGRYVYGGETPSLYWYKELLWNQNTSEILDNTLWLATCATVISTVMGTAVA